MWRSMWFAIVLLCIACDMTESVPKDSCPAYFQKPSSVATLTNECSVTINGSLCTSCCPDYMVCCDAGGCLPWDPFCQYPTSCCADKYCGDRCCPTSYGQPCGPMCAPNSFTCCDTTTGHMCSKPQSCCGTTCIDSSQQQCCSAGDQNTGPLVCSNSQTCCGRTCCDKSSQTCCGTGCCDQGSCNNVGQCCKAGNPVCYGNCCPENNYCVAGQNGLCCPNGYTYAGSGKCCENDRPMLCPDLNTCCPSDQKCCGDHCCPSDHTCCGELCCPPGGYCSADQKRCCMNGDTYCPNSDSGNCYCGSCTCNGGSECDTYSKSCSGWWIFKHCHENANPSSQCNIQSTNLAKKSTLKQDVTKLLGNAARPGTRIPIQTKSLAPKLEIANAFKNAPIVTPQAYPCFASITNSMNACDVYGCLENVTQCGNDGVIQSANDLYCYRYIVYRNDFSPSGQTFMSCVNNCTIPIMMKAFKSGVIPCCNSLQSYFQDNSQPCMLSCGFCDIFWDNVSALEKLLELSTDDAYLIYADNCLSRQGKT